MREARFSGVRSAEIRVRGPRSCAETTPRALGDSVLWVGHKSMLGHVITRKLRY